MPGTRLYTLYYELPGAGGGNIPRLTHETASARFLDLMVAYPDAYIAIIDENGETIRSCYVERKEELT